MSTDTTSYSGPLSETADIVSSSDEYAKRFAGATGQWMLDIQARIVLKLLSESPGISILDVGGGHGQLSKPLTENGYDVTVFGSDDSCKKRIQDIVDTGTCKFASGNVLALPYEDDSFDTAISFRMVTHCQEWQTLIKELCRVARRAVIVDYPTSQSMNFMAPRFFAAKKRVEKNTRRWHLFRHDEITRTFNESDFVRHKSMPQFFIPMVVHRVLRCKPLSAFTEAVFKGTGLTKVLGTPVIVEARPKQAQV